MRALGGGQFHHLTTPRKRRPSEKRVSLRKPDTKEPAHKQGPCFDRTLSAPYSHLPVCNGACIGSRYRRCMAFPGLTPHPPPGHFFHERCEQAL